MSVDSKEVELKLHVPREIMGDLQAHPHFHELLKIPAREEMLVSTYFDSDNFDLREHGISLRVRKVGDRNLQSIKRTGRSGRFFERGELEREIAGDLPDLGFALDTSLRPLLTEELRDAIRPIFETRVKRKTYFVSSRDSDIEMSFDNGQIIAGSSMLPLSEIEIELKRGNPADLFHFARSISAAVPAQLLVQSKSERGYDLLLMARGDEAFAADEILLTPDLTAAEAFKSIGHACLRHIVANQSGVLARDAKSLHQMRIGLRRLRVAISAFSDIVADDQVNDVKAQLKNFAHELAQARNLEVLVTQVLRQFHHDYPQEKGFISLNRAFKRDRLKEYRHAAEVIGSDAFRKFVIDCAAWVEAGPWTYELSAQAQLPVTVHAAMHLSSCRKKCGKLGRRLDKLDSNKLHEMRIRVKKLRYATEFLQNLYVTRKLTKRCKKFLSEAQDLQEALGGLNDLTTRYALFSDMMNRKARFGSQRRVFAAGLIIGQQETSVARLKKAAIKAFTKLDNIKPFWKLSAPELQPSDDSVFRQDEDQTAAIDVTTDKSRT